MSATKISAAWGKCAICDAEVMCESMDAVAAQLQAHHRQAHPDVQFMHQIDAARLAWQLKQNRMH